MTEDQFRLRLDQIRAMPHEEACWQLLDLLAKVLPPLLEAAERGRQLRSAPAWFGLDVARQCDE